MAMSGKERAELRSEAHHLTALVHLGHQGITPSLVESLDDALRTRELVKVQLAKQAELPAREAAARLADAVGAEVVQVIGRTTTLYRHNPELRRRAGDPPPWRR
ncbi:MAG TPA: YhbY family RNA-binding protein [Gemmatimonadaceae bacterium]|nr:YhbY family RNA-binding protein [Gemmatimonadaceae bacterium]